MEEIKKDTKDFISLIAVIILIVIAVIGCLLIFVKPTKLLDKIKKTPVDEKVTEELKYFLGINVDDCYNNSFNYALNQNAEAFFSDDYKDLDYANIMFKSAIEKNYTGITSNENCGGEEGICYFIKNENYVKIKNLFELKTQVPNPRFFDDDFVYILFSRDLACLTKANHKVEAWYKDTNNDEIVLEDKIEIINIEDNSKTKEKYTYTFRVTENGYVLTDIEK